MILDLLKTPVGPCLARVRVVRVVRVVHVVHVARVVRVVRIVYEVAFGGLPQTRLPLVPRIEIEIELFGSVLCFIFRIHSIASELGHCLKDLFNVTKIFICI